MKFVKDLRKRKIVVIARTAEKYVKKQSKLSYDQQKQ